LEAIVSPLPFHASSTLQNWSDPKMLQQVNQPKSTNQLNLYTIRGFIFIKCELFELATTQNGTRALACRILAFTRSRLAQQALARHFSTCSLASDNQKTDETSDAQMTKTMACALNSGKEQQGKERHTAGQGRSDVVVLGVCSG
jgi:hypothetical protein